MPIFFGDEHQKKFQFLLVEYVSTNIERKCQLPLDSTMFDFQVHWKGKLITRISGVSISSPMGTGVMLEILGFLGNHVLPKFIFKNNPNKHQSHMEELSCFAFFVFFALFAFRKTLVISNFHGLFQVARDGVCIPPFGLLHCDFISSETTRWPSNVFFSGTVAPAKGYIFD